MPFLTFLLLSWFDIDQKPDRKAKKRLVQIASYLTDCSIFSKTVNAIQSTSKIHSLLKWFSCNYNDRYLAARDSNLHLVYYCFFLHNLITSRLPGRYYYEAIRPPVLPCRWLSLFFALVPPRCEAGISSLLPTTIAAWPP